MTNQNSESSLGQTVKEVSQKILGIDISPIASGAVFTFLLTWFLGSQAQEGANDNRPFSWLRDVLRDDFETSWRWLDGSISFLSKIHLGFWGSTFAILLAVIIAQFNGSVLNRFPKEESQDYKNLHGKGETFPFISYIVFLLALIEINGHPILTFLGYIFLSLIPLVASFFFCWWDTDNLSDVLNTYLGTGLAPVFYLAFIVIGGFFLLCGSRYHFKRE